MQSAGRTGIETRNTREWNIKYTFKLCSSQTVKLNITKCLNCAEPKYFHYCITVTERRQHTLILLSDCNWRSEGDKHFSRSNMLRIILEWEASKWNFICTKAKFLSYFRLSLLMCTIVMVSCFLLLIFKQISKSSDEMQFWLFVHFDKKKKHLVLVVLVGSVRTVQK